MAKRNKHKVKKSDELQIFHELNDYVRDIAQGNMRKGRFYSLCVRASFAKCYEFNLHIWDDSISDSAFFCLPTLRGICEDLIILNYIQVIPHKERESLVMKLMRHELHGRLKTQSEFFTNSRPHQSVLSPFLPAEEIEVLENEIRSIWQSHGWPNMKHKVMPPTRQIAEKHGGDILATLYDYLYRLTSSTVHFNVGGLFRTGWGDKPHCTFSPTHFNKYYQTFGRIYGAFMFCSYFELFARILRTDDEIKQAVNTIRQSILRIPRWPEMVTHEELNIKPPNIGILQLFTSFLQSETEKRLLKK